MVLEFYLIKNLIISSAIRTSLTIQSTKIYWII